MSKHWGIHLWFWKWLCIEQGESLLHWVMLPDVVVSTGDDADSGSPHPRQGVLLLPAYFLGHLGKLHMDFQVPLGVRKEGSIF